MVMYYPIGWHKVLKLDTKCGQERCNVLLVQANPERELFFVLTTRSIHIFYSRPSVEIVSHKRSQDSIESIGLNRTAVWKPDSSVIAVCTVKDQLLFYQLRRRISPTTPTTFLFQGYENDCIYRLKHQEKELKKVYSRESFKELISSSKGNEADFIPSLTICSFGKLDFSVVGITSLLSAEEELVIASRSGNIFGVHWNGNVDEKFPWSLPKRISKNLDYVVDLKFSSILSGFALVLRSGRAGFMSKKLNFASEGDSVSGLPNVAQCENGDIMPPSPTSSTSSQSRINQRVHQESPINYVADITDAICVEVNHKFRLVAYGLRSSKIIVCNIGDPNVSPNPNQTLQQDFKSTHEPNSIGQINCMRYSPDSFALAVSWEGSGFAIWSVFGSLLFTTQQWQLESRLDLRSVQSLSITSFAWGREGYNIWMNVLQEEGFNENDNESIISTEPASSATTSSNSNEVNGLQKAQPRHLNSDDGTIGESFNGPIDELIILSMAHSNLPSSPQLTCCSDSIILLSENRVYIGPSVPHRAEFDQWFVVDVPQSYLGPNYPIHYASVDRECKNLAIAGMTGFALYSIETGRWRFLGKKPQDSEFTICGDLIWWQDYLVFSCFNVETDSFELRAYPTLKTIENSNAIIESVPMEISRMSIFENRMLVLYCDGNLGMFMLNLRRRPDFRKSNKTRFNQVNSINPSPGTADSTASPQIDVNDASNGQSSKSRSDSIASLNYPLKKVLPDYSDVILQIAPIENLIISNLQANAHCITSIALTKLHFKNERSDDSILLNSCGKLFLLERESSHFATPSPTSDPPSNDFHDLSLGSQKSNDSIEVKVQSAKRFPSSAHFASASLRSNIAPDAFTNVTFKAVSVIATNVEQFWISPEISHASDMSYFKKSLWLYCGGSKSNHHHLKVWLPLLNDKKDPPADLYVPDRIMIPIRCDIYPLAIRSSSVDVIEPDDAIVLGAENEVIFRDSDLFERFPYSTVKRQCRVYLHRILRELLLNLHLGYYARKIAESCQSLPYFAHCFELLLHEVLEEETTSPIPLPDPMLPQVVKFIKEFPVYLETVVHCARKSELSMWSHLFDERAVGNPRRLFQECLEAEKLDTAASCLIILHSLDRGTVSQKMVRELIKAAKSNPKYEYLIQDLEGFLTRAELDYSSLSTTSSGPSSPNTVGSNT